MLPLSRLSPESLDAEPLLRKERELARLAGMLETALHPIAARSLSSAMSGIHSYYSNLIEGASTHPITAELAAAGRLSAPKDKEASDKYQRQALAGIAASLQMKAELEANADLDVASEHFIRFLHHAFTSRLPDEMRVVRDEAGGEDKVIPGEFRRRHVAVGTYIPPEPGELRDLMTAFEEMYCMGAGSVRVSLLLHHRFAWIHPFLDGNGRTARLLTEAMLSKAGVGGSGLWSLSRGLAKRRADYLRLISLADTGRKGDFDGRGSLSREESEGFVDFMLDVALDQAQFMVERLQADHLFKRLETFCGERALVLGRDERAFALLKEALVSGSMERGRAGPLVGLSSRRASDIVKECLDDKLLLSPSDKGPLSIGFPMYSLAYLFPHLFPVDDPQAAMKASCTDGKPILLSSEIADAQMPERESRTF